MKTIRLFATFLVAFQLQIAIAQIMPLSEPGGGGGTPPAAPPAPTVSTNTCGDKIVTRSGTPPSGEQWFWQTTYNGTSMSNSSATYTVSLAGTRNIYIRSYRISSATWGGYSYVSVTVNPNPGTPAVPTQNTSCGAPALVRGTPPAGTTWYWQGTDANGTSSANSALEYPVSTSDTYYLRARSSAGCWSPSSAAKTAVVLNPSVTSLSRIEPGFMTLTSAASTSYTVKWYDAASGGNLLHTNHELSKYFEGNTTYYVSASSSTNCEGPRVPVTVTIQPKPVVAYSYPFLVKGKTVQLSVANNTYSSYQWYRNDGTTTTPVGTTPTINVTDQPGSYYVSVTKNTMTGTGISESFSVQYGQNYVRVNSVAKEGITSETAIPTLPIGERAQLTSYIGGLGNPLQSIASKVSPANKDMISFSVYGADGIQTNQYLPYTSTADNSEYRSAVIAEQASFYTNTSKVASDSKPYSAIELEKSPLGRVLSATGVGNLWHTNNKKTSAAYLLSRATEGIRVWRVLSTGLPTSTTTYADYQLFINQTTDENGNGVKTYTDKVGRIIVKMVEADATTWLRTYYVYNDKGQLAYVLSPEGVSKNIYTPNQAFLDQWSFQYRYDNYGRLIEHKAPASGWQYFVYDALHRVVMTQDALQRTESRWMFVKYDVKGRPVITGSKVIVSSTRTTVQTSVNGQAHLYENKAVSPVGYTLDRTYPTAVDGDLLSVSYFDNYEFLGYSGWDAEANSFAFVPEMGSTAYETAVVGLPTGGKIKVLGATTWLNAVQYYDKYYRPLQMTSENHLAGLDRNTNKYNNLRQLVENRLSHHNGSAIVIRKMQFDHAGRVIKVFQNINSAATDQLVAQYEYNALGQLVDKKLHNTSGTAFLQSVDYRYTIRGWISSINNAGLNVNSSNNDESTDYFGMEFIYNTVDAGVGNSATHNGNISAVKWKGPGAAAGLNEQSAYKFTYDKSERMTTAIYVRSASSGWNDRADALNENATYDLNGNIKTLQRNHAKHVLTGVVPSYVSELMDNLTYTYSTTQGNQLVKVADAVPLAIGRNDFKDNANLATEYGYNTNGDLTMDKNKGIDSVHYNMLGKVRRVKFTNGTVVVYFYDASGNKIKMKTSSGGTTTTTDYLGGFVYEQGSLVFLASPEGRVVISPSQENKIANATCATTSGFAANQNVTITAMTLNGENYVKAVCNQASSTPGVYPIGGDYLLAAGDTYRFRVKGYASSGTPRLYVMTNLGDLVWPGPVLPVGASNEGEVSVQFTIPSGATFTRVGVLWHTPAIGQEFYLNQVELTKISFDYQYAIADNQGNTRVVFSSVTPQASAPTATFEGTTGDNSGEYMNVDPDNIVTNTAANYTSGGSKVLRMNQTYKIGPSKSTRVFPGDKIDIEVWEYHEGSSGFGTSGTGLTTLISLVSGAFGGVSGGAGDPGLIYNGVDQAINAFLPGGNLGSSRPAAYLNYILFDVNYKVLDMGWVPAPATTFTKQKLSFPTKTIKEAGYMFVYLSYDNDSNNWVYFDNLKVTHTKTNVIQYNEYYPFGLQTAGSWTREDATDNKYLYNGGAELNATTSWYETFFRGYDATLGRFLQVDPLAAHASSFTPYNYAFNNPVMFNDPMGDYPQEVKDDMEAHERYLRETGGGARHLGSFNPFAGYQGPGSQYHWSDGYRSAEGNLAIMSQANWLSFYGVTDGSGQIDTERRDQFASALSVAPGQQHIEQVAKRYKLNVESIRNGVMYVATTLEAPLYLNGLEAENQIKPGTYTYHAIYLGAQQGERRYSFEHEYWGIASGDFEELGGNSASTRFNSIYRMKVDVLVWQVGERLKVRISASSFVSSGKLMDTQVHMLAQILIDGKKGSEIVRLTVPPNSISFNDNQNTYVGEAQFAIPDQGRIQLLYDGGWKNNGWETPYDITSGKPINVLGNIIIR